MSGLYFIVIPTPQNPPSTASARHTSDEMVFVPAVYGKGIKPCKDGSYTPSFSHGVKQHFILFSCAFLHGVASLLSFTFPLVWYANRVLRVSLCFRRRGLGARISFCPYFVILPCLWIAFYVIGYTFIFGIIVYDVFIIITLP